MISFLKISSTSSVAPAEYVATMLEACISIEVSSIHNKYSAYDYINIPYSMPKGVLKQIRESMIGISTGETFKKQQSPPKSKTPNTLILIFCWAQWSHSLFPHMKLYAIWSRKSFEHFLAPMWKSYFRVDWKFGRSKKKTDPPKKQNQNIRKN